MTPKLEELGLWANTTQTNLGEKATELQCVIDDEFEDIVHALSANLTRLQFWAMRKMGNRYGDGDE